MSENTQSKLGKLIQAEEYRDAVHIAVAPVVAAKRLRAGQHVSLDKAGKAVGTGDTIGIVDPFLLEVVMPGETFWLFLYPNTITTLRHEWTHPAFGGPQEPPRDRIAEAKAEIEGIALEMGSDGYDYYGDDADPGSGDPMTYERLMGAAEDWIRGGDYHTQHGGQSWQDGGFPAHRFWALYAIVTGRPVPENKAQNFFSCSC